MKVSPGASYVAQSNTPESDAMPMVLHVVEGHDEAGQLVHTKLMARDPLDAFDRAKAEGLEWVPGSGHKRVTPKL